MHIKDDFASGAPISQVPASWFNRVAKFINSLTGGVGVTLNKRDDGGASLIEVTASSTPESPATFDNLVTSGEGSATASTAAHTYDGEKGVKVSICTRVCYDNNASNPVLYGFSRTFTYDKNGLLYAVSGETRYVIDEPVIFNGV